MCNWRIYRNTLVEKLCSYATGTGEGCIKSPRILRVRRCKIPIATHLQSSVMVPSGYPAYPEAPIVADRFRQEASDNVLYLAHSAGYSNFLCPQEACIACNRLLFC